MTDVMGAQAQVMVDDTKVHVYTRAARLRDAALKILQNHPGTYPADIELHDVEDVVNWLKEMEL